MVQIARHSELHKLAAIPKCWVMGRSFAWLDKTGGYMQVTKKNQDTTLGEQFCKPSGCKISPAQP